MPEPVDKAAPGRHPSRRDRGEETRQRLIVAAVRLFGERGFDGTATRELAAAAGANLAAIPYHFGGKEALYNAAADHIAGQVASHLSPQLRQVDRVLEGGRLDRATARDLLYALVDGFATLVIQPESEEWVRFVLREQMHPTAAFERIYASLIGRIAGVLVRVVATLSGEPADSDTVRLRAISVIGQILIFRVGRATVLRVLDWGDIDADGAAAIRRVLRENVDRLLAIPEAGGV
ncbi:MAG: CerR family C-terminal domain-containing protein [Azospirillaceae bacterium]